MAAGQYIVTVTDIMGCHETDSVEIQASNGPISSFTFDTFGGCSPLCITFQNTTITTSYTTIWDWDFGDGIHSITPSPMHCFSNPGNYDVTLTAFDTVGCVDTGYAAATIVIQQTPEAQFTISPASPVSLGTPVQFNDQSTNATTWSWSFGTGDTTGSSLQHPVYSYPQTGDYTAELIVTNGSCSDTASMFIQIEVGFTAFAPNAFTPNANGLNETFRPQGVLWDRSRYEFSVYDRWGMRIFHTNDPDQGWDGTFKGAPVQVDTYVWKARIFDIRGQEHMLIGHVSVVR
jgi:gliding motility-associated-like protein